MYIRFVTLSIDEHSKKPQGFFQAANRLIDEGDFDRHEISVLDEIFHWFNKNMIIPKVLKGGENTRCLSWFKSDAKEPIERMWIIFYMLQAKGIAVEVVKETDVGEIHYEDEWQIVAQPHRHNRKRHYGKKRYLFNQES